VSDGKRGKVDAIRLTPDDNVATVLRRIEPGELVQVQCGMEISTIRAGEPIPLCHKISLDPLAVGASVLKYGERIGTASAAISAGAHVHVHNMQSARATVAGAASSRSKKSGAGKPAGHSRTVQN